MDETAAEFIKITTSGQPRVGKRQLVTVVRLVATPWPIDGPGRVAFRAEAIVPMPVTAAGSAKTATGRVRDAQHERAERLCKEAAGRAGCLPALAGGPIAPTKFDKACSAWTARVEAIAP